MDKLQFLSLVKSVAQKKLVTRGELLTAFEGGQISPNVSPLSNYDGMSAEKNSLGRINVADVLYWVGGGVVALGIVILVSLNWDSMSDSTQLLVTLGSALLLYAAGVLLDHGDKKSKLGTGFHLIAALIMPIGLFIAFDQASLLEHGVSAVTGIAAILFFVYGLSTLLYKRTIFAFFALVYGTGFVLALVSWLTENSFFTYEFYTYITAGLGLAYMTLGKAAAGSRHNVLSNLLYTVGTAGFLGALFALGGYRATDVENIFWNWSYLGFVFGTIFMSVHFQSRVILFISSLFMAAYVIKTTNEYFTDTAGWPVTIIASGFVIMGVGYLMYYLNKKYIKTA